MFIDPAGRAIEYMGQLDDTQVSVQVWRNTATDTTTQWKQGTVLTPSSLFDLGGWATYTPSKRPWTATSNSIHGKWKQSSN